MEQAAGTVKTSATLVYNPPLQNKVFLTDMAVFIVAINASDCGKDQCHQS